MTIWKKESGVWVEQNSKEPSVNTVYDNEADTTFKKYTPSRINYKVDNANSDYILRFFLPKEYNDNSRVNPNQIADVIFSLAEKFGGASVSNNKGYWVNNDLLYQDNNVVIDVLLPKVNPEKAILIGEYISSSIGITFKQMSALFLLIPVLSEFIDSKDYQNKLEESLSSIDFLNGENNE